MFVKKTFLIVVTASVIISGAPRCFPLEQFIDIVKTLVSETFLGSDTMSCHELSSNEESESQKLGLNRGRACECEVSVAHVAFPPREPEGLQFMDVLLLTIGTDFLSDSLSILLGPPEPPPPRMLS